MGQCMTGYDPILTQAANWHASLSGENPDFDGFALWLESAPAHRDAYDQMVMLDAVIDEHADVLRVACPANEVGAVEPAPRRRWSILLTIAAVFALAMIVAPRLLPGSTVTESTRIGETRTIALSDDAKIHLDAASALRFDKGEGRKASLLNGRALFTVRHKADDPFTLDVGDYQVRDLGTQFEVSRDGDAITIMVAEGKVAVGGRGMAFIEAKAGEQIQILSGRASKSRIDQASVASWRTGRLVYDNAPLEQVVADINRYTQKKLVLDPSLSEQRFSGVLTIGEGTQLAQNLANLMGLPLVETGSGQYLGHRP